MPLYRTKRCRSLHLEFLEVRRPLAIDLNFLGDLATTSTSPGLFSHAITNVNGIAYFSGIIADAGFGLWKSDGTWGGTQLLEENIQPQNLVTVGNSLYFVGTHGGRLQLWKSDGTAAGTALASTVAPKVGTLTNVNGTLFFAGSDLSGQTGLFKFNSAASTAELILASGPSTAPLELVNVNGTLFFNALKPGSTTQRGLWRSNGTAAGTVRIDASQANFDPQGLTNFNGTLVFSALESEGRELWKSDGTTDGTVLVKDTSPGDSSSSPDKFTVIGDKLFLTATQDASGRELFISDGTQAGTFRVKDIFAGSSSSFPNSLTNVNGQLFFTAISEQGRELWVSDGTSPGTRLVKDITAGSSDTVFNGLVNLNGKLLFSARNGQYGDELWASDGTEAGTAVVKDIVPGAEGSLPGVFPTSAAGCFSRLATARMAASSGAPTAQPREPSLSKTSLGTRARTRRISPASGEPLFLRPTSIIRPKARFPQASYGNPMARPRGPSNCSTLSEASWASMGIHSPSSTA